MAQGDLISLPQLKAYLGVQSTADDLVLASLISQISRAISTYLNRPFIWPRNVVDVFDGNGRARIQLRHWPVVAVASVSIEGRAVPQATSELASGWMLEAGDDEPPGAMQMLMLRGGVFLRGWQNVSVAYRAGYEISNEACTAPGAPAFVVAAQPFGAWSSDGGVAYVNGEALGRVAGNPGQGQYAIDGNGGYLFSPQDAGQSLQLNYGYVPLDLANCALEWAADRYRYREKIAMTSKSLGGQETTSFRITAVPDFVSLSLRNFSRIIAN